MLSAMAAAVVAIWFYNTAQRSGRPALSWAFSGVAVYFLVALLWTFGVTASIKDAASHSQGGLLVGVVQYAYIIAGLVAAGLVNAWLNKSNSSK